MSVRQVDENAYSSQAQQFRSDVASVPSYEGELTFDALSETEKSAATIGVSPNSWRPIGWINQGFYTELRRKNALSGRLTQQIEAFKLVASS